jgi:tRNA nucleotidyltransferase (CCA-adding enzyme)
VRELRESVKYPPSAGRRKVYIIDEVHMLSTEAFNALLKTLEEPPEYETFILATTEVHKLPATVLSRCMRLDFKRVPESVLMEGMADICAKIGIDVTEDALRIFRAVRFCAKLGFELDPGTRRAAEELAPSLKLVSAERIQTELVKLLVSPHPEMISLAWECGITAQVLPEFDLIMEAPQNNPHHIFSVGEHTIRTLMAIRADRILRLTMLFHDMGKPSVQTVDENGIYHHRGHAAPGAEIAGRIMRRLKFDRASERSVVQLVRCHSLYPDLTPEGVRRAVVRIGEDLFPLLLEVKCADIRGQNPEVQKEKLAYMDRVKELYEEILADGDCLSLKQLAVSGDDLLADGMKKGPELGSVLQALLDEVLEDPARNRKEYLLERSRSLRV